MSPIDIKFIAKAYIDAGWAVLPLVPGEKKASTKWQSRTYAPADFPPDAGIAGKCGEPSGSRVDVDLDHPIAVKIAHYFLPDTGLIHGRPGKPNSHWWYICVGIKTRQYTGLKQADGSKQMLVEIRSTSSYTALPPSGHPSGDTLAWVSEGAPLCLIEEDLIEAVNYLAIATLVAIHYPGHGARHRMVGNLAGFLCQIGINPMVVPRIIEAAAFGADDSDLRDRVEFARATVQKYLNDKDAKLTGGPSLADDLGKDVVNKIRSWMGVENTDAIEEMNERHFWVRIGRDDVIGREDTRDGNVVFQRPQALRTEYANRLVKVGEKVNKTTGEKVDQFKSLFEAWLESHLRRSYREVVFLPPPHKADERDYNLWKRYAITPAPGECGLFLAHLEDVICSGNTEHFDYLLNLLALTIQEPGTPSEVAVVLRGEQGTGKGVFVRTLGEIFGKHFIHLDNVKHLTGGFNAALSGKIIVFADEAFWAGNKSQLGALKRLITEPTLAIERKGIDVMSEMNCVHLFMATNEEWAIPAGLDERRFFALEVNNAHKQDIDYFKALNEELQNGGTGAFLDLMLKYPIDRDLVRRVPRTRELRQQQELTLAPLLEWWHACLFEGVVPNPYGNTWPAGQWIPMPLLYKEYVEWASQRRHHLLSTSSSTSISASTRSSRMSCRRR